MKISFNEEFVKKLDLIKGFTGKRNPIAGLIYIEAKEDGTILARAVSETSAIEWNMQGENWNVEEPGVVLIDPRTVLPVLNRLDGEAIIRVKDNRIKVRAGRKKLEIAAAGDPKQFPAFEKITGNGIKVTEDFLLALRKVGYAAAETSSRPILQGIHVNSQERLLIVGCDSYRMAKVEVESEALENIKAFTFIPPEGNVMKMLESSEHLLMFIAETYVGFTNGEWTIRLNLLEGQYPNITPIFNNIKKHEHFVVDRASLLEAVRNSRVLKNKTVVLDIQENRLTITTKDETGVFMEEIPIEGGAELRIGISGKFLEEALAVMETDKVKIGYKQKLDPIILQPHSETAGLDELHLIQPVRLVED